MLSHLAFHELGEAAQGERRAVGLAHEEPLEDHGIEVTLGSPHQETVQLDEELEVDIVRPRRGALRLLVPPAGNEVDT
ncbi:Os05g0155050, partial [Oryza sativa Japonica Group]